MVNLDDLKARMPKEQPEPEVVYHYTTMDTMLKIVKDREIWATNIEYLNDSTERIHFLELLKKRIPEYKKINNIHGDDVFHSLLQDKHSMRSFTERYPFVASFSLIADSLSQWRSYCPNGNGVSIGFRTDCLRRATVKAAEQPTQTAPHSLPTVQGKVVQYASARDTEDIDWLLGIYELAAHPQTGIDGVDMKDLVSYFCEHEACSRKDPSFSNEEEYRLLVTGIPIGGSHLQFRTSRSTLVPYVVLSIPRRHSEYSAGAKASNPLSAWVQRLDFVDRVVIGPTANMTLSQTAVEAFFRSQNMSVHVRTSKIPYRDW